MMVSIDDGARDDDELMRYLVGALPADEIERLDELSVSDRDFAERLRAVEHDLVDAYAEGRLPSDMLTHFEAQYLSTPRGRGKVRFAAALRDHAPLNAPTVSRRASDGRWVFRSLALAAGLLLSALAGYLLIDNLRLRTAMKESAAARASLEQRERQLQARVSEQEAAAAQREGAAADRSAGFARVFSFVLAAPTRGVDAVPTLSPPADAPLSLTLTLDADDFPRYQIVVRDAATDTIVARAESVRASRRSGDALVQIEIAAGVLKARRYVAEVSGVRAGSPPEAMNSYAFRIVTK